MSISRSQTAFWGVAFVVLFILSLDFWTWERPVRFGLFQLPVWVYYFALLQFLLAGLLYFFSVKYWETPVETEEDSE